MVETVLLVVLISAGVLMVGLVLYGLACYVPVAMSYANRTMADATDSMRTGSAAIRNRMAWKARKREFAEWLDAKLGADTISALDEDLLTAKNQAPMLRRLVQEEVPATISRCVATHRIAALAAGADTIYEIASEPECIALRERMVLLVEATVERLQTFPLLIDDTVLINNLVVLRRVCVICRRCPYLHHKVYNAPALCPSAEIAGIEPERKSNE